MAILKTLRSWVAQPMVETALAVQAEVMVNTFNNTMFQYINKLPIGKTDGNQDYMGLGFQSNEDVYSVVHKIAEKCAMTPVLLYEIQKDGSKIEVSNHPLKEIMDDPNPNTTGFDFIYQNIVFLLITGNDYIYGVEGAKKGLFYSLYNLPAHMTNIIGGDKFKPVSGYNVFWGSNDTNTFKVNEVQHIKIAGFDYNQQGGHLYGQSPLRAAFKNTLTRNNLTNQQVGKQMQNAGSAGFVTNEQEKFNLTNEQKAALEQTIKRKMGSTDDWDRFIVANGALKWTPIGFPLADLQALEMLGWDLKKFCNIYGWPIQLMNSEAASTDNNMDWAAKNAINNTVSPLLKRLAGGLNRFLVKPYNKYEGKNYVLEFDTNQLPEMQTNVKELVDWLDKAWFLTPNQKLEMLKFGRNADTALDKVYIPQGLQPLDENSFVDDGDDNL